MNTQTLSTARALPQDERIAWPESIPFFAVHLMCLAVFFTPFHWRDLLVCVGLYFFRMWGVTAGYHRYFSHRSYKAGRGFQFFLALAGTLATQKGVLWWAANHRHHHRYSDLEEDIHSPTLRGFLWSHVGWILCRKYGATQTDRIKDFMSYPELRWLNRFHLVPPVLLAVALYFIGGFSLLVWGFFVSTTLLWHGTFTINSLSHIFGKRRYKTTDTSRNNWLLALITMGEGWHNNHHYHQNTANQGWFWWEVDLSYYVLTALSWVGLVSDLRKPSESIKYSFLKYSEADRAALATGTPFGASAPAPALARVKESASEKVRGVLASAAESLPAVAATPQPLLEQQ